MERAVDVTTSAAGPANDARPAALLPLQSAEVLDEESALEIVTAYRRHGIGVAVGTAAPASLGLLLLDLASEGVVAVPGQALAAVLALGLFAVPLALLSSRRAFLDECVTLGISRARAKQLYRRMVSSWFHLERSRTRAARDAAVAELLRSP